MDIVFVGIDLAKNVFAVHGVNQTGKPELVRPRVLREEGEGGQRPSLLAARPLQRRVRPRWRQARE